jgi:hypothetical protein
MAEETTGLAGTVYETGCKLLQSSKKIAIYDLNIVLEHIG